MPKRRIKAAICAVILKALRRNPSPGCRCMVLPLLTTNAPANGRPVRFFSGISFFR